MPLTDDQEDTLRWSFFTTSVFTVVAGAALFWAYFACLRKKKTDTMILKLILALLVCNMGSSMSAFFNGLGGGAQCTIQAMMQLFFEVAGVMWVMALTFTGFGAVVMRLDRDMLKRLRWVYHIAAWGSGLFAVIIGFSTKSVGEAGGWCWVKKEKTAVRFLVLYAWMALAYIVILILQSWLMIVLCRLLRTSPTRLGESKSQRRARSIVLILKLWIYPVVFLIMFTPIFAFRMLELSNDTRTDNGDFFWLQVWGSFYNLQGFLDVGLYALRADVVKRLWLKIRCGCCPALMVETRRTLEAEQMAKLDPVSMMSERLDDPSFAHHHVTQSRRMSMTE